MATLVNRAKVSTGTTGTGTITLGSAVSGFQTFADAGVSNGDTVRYVIEDGTSWELGTGTYSSTGPTLTRTVAESSAGGSALNLSGNAEVFISATSADTDNWNTAYGWGDHSTEGYLTGNQTITLSGDVSGSGTTAISVTVADDSHNHVIANVDGLQAALDAKLDDSQKGAANGLAELDGSGKVPSAQLPSYVDDVLEYANSGSFPGTGETGKIYIALDTNDVYRWTGSAYVKVSDAVSTADEANTLATARTISLAGDVTGSTSFDGSANVSITATVADDSHSHVIANVDGLQTALDGKLGVSANAASASELATARTISLAGDVTGSTSFDGSANVSITATVADDSHSHVIANVDGLQTALDGKLGVSANAASASELATARTISLAGDVTGSTSFDGSANVSITATVADDSHSHVIANVDGLQTALDGKQAAGTYNTIIGTDSDLNTSGATIIDNIFVTDGVITSMGTRNLQALDISAARTITARNYTSTTTQALFETEFTSAGYWDTYLAAGKASWSYAGNADLTDAGRLTELAGCSFLTWKDNSGVGTPGTYTALVIAPNTGGSAGKTFIYNDQGSSYSPGWREVWTSLSDGSGSGLDADLLDGVHGSSFLRSDAADQKTSGTLRFNDNVIASFGSSDDWEFFHNGSHNYMDCNVGDLYIRQGTTSRYLFDVSSGNFHADGNIIAYSTSVSDERLKDDINTLEDPLSLIDELRGVTFTRKDQQEKSSGVIAQELEKVMPWAVKENQARILKGDETVYKTVEYDALSALFIESIKALKDEIADLKQQLENK